MLISFKTLSRERIAVDMIGFQLLRIIKENIHEKGTIYIFLRVIIHTKDSKEWYERSDQRIGIKR